MFDCEGRYSVNNARESGKERKKTDRKSCHIQKAHQGKSFHEKNLLQTFTKMAMHLSMNNFVLLY
jgi:hypothetical protein